MSNPTESFIRTYEEIVTQVNRRAGASSSHSFKIEMAADCDVIVKRNQDLLKYVRDIRHLLQHPKRRSEGDAVEVSEAFLSEVQALLSRLKNPPTANSVGVPRKEIKTASLTDRLGDLADGMKRSGFSHVPILNDSGAVIGVFNEAAMFDHLWAEADTIVSREMQISDILPHCLLDAEHTETFRFVKPRAPIDDLIEMFRALESPTTRVGAAFVTASGKETEALQRLITSWDVISIPPN